MTAAVPAAVPPPTPGKSHQCQQLFSPKQYKDSSYQSALGAQEAISGPPKKATSLSVTIFLDGSWKGSFF